MAWPELASINQKLCMYSGYFSKKQSLFYFSHNKKLQIKSITLKMSFNLGFIGGGNMSTAIVEGILKNDAHPRTKIWVSGPRLHNLKHWSEMGTHVTVKNGEVYSNCDVIFLGVKPGMLDDAVNDCLATLPHPVSCKSVVFVSMLAGIKLDHLCKVLSQLSKDMQVIRIMPNTPALVGAGACLITPGPNVPQDSCVTVEKLMSNCGICETVPEILMDSLGALVGCGPAYIYIVIEALADGAVKQGVPRATAQQFAAQMVMGSAKMVLHSGKHPALLKDEVCSPGGSTICGVAELEAGQIRSTFIKALEASTRRHKELGNK